MPVNGAYLGRPSSGRARCIEVTVDGIADFANAFLQARSAGVVTQLGAAYYIPIVIVPAALVAHVMILGLLLRRSA